MTDTTVSARQRKAEARQAARRRRAVNLLAITECTCRYAANQLSNGVSPQEAQEVALFVAGELEAVAGALRRLTRLDGPQRRALAVQLAALGVGTRRIAATVGVSERCVRYYVAGRAAAAASSGAGTRLPAGR